jgi:hypothetical protein
MRSLLQHALAVALLVAAGDGPAGTAQPGAPAGPAPPPRVTPAGTVLFADDFRSLSAWRADRDGVWSVQRGVLLGRLPSRKQERSFLYAGSEDWHDYALDLDVCQLRGVDKGAAVGVQGTHGVGVDLRGGEYQDVLLYRQEVPLGRAKAANADGAWHHLRVEMLGARYRVLVDGALVLDRREALGAARRGRIALAAYTGGLGECTVLYANVVVTKLARSR